MIVMITKPYVFAALAAFSLANAPAAMAGANDFEFQPVSAEIKNGAAAELAVRLIDKRTGKPVPGAVLFRTCLDMSPESVGEMLAEKMRRDDAYVRAMREALEFKSWGSSDGRYLTREEMYTRGTR